MITEVRELTENEISEISGGFVCGGLCILGGIGAAVALFSAGVSVGEKLYQATR